MKTQFKLSIVAAAVGLVVSGAAFANGANLTPNSPITIGAGASAVKANVVRALVGVNGTAGLCGTNAVTYYDNATADISAGTSLPGGSIFRIVCGSYDVGYDTKGGSWKSLIAANSAMMTNAQNTALNADPVKFVDNTTGTTSAIALASFSAGGVVYTFNAPVTYVWGATATPAVAGNDIVDFGMADVENSMWNYGPNQPIAPDGTYATPTFSGTEIATALKKGAEAAGYPKAAFGIVFGVAASPALYTALQTAQGLNGTVYNPATGAAVACGGVKGYTNQLCVPSISKADYRSIASGTNASASLAALYLPVDLARRDQGSGTQANSNSFFFNGGCSASSSVTEGADLSPALPNTTGLASGLNVSYNAATGDVLNRITGTTAYVASNSYVIGVVSAENDSSGKLGGGGFVKIDGVYPSAATAALSGQEFVGMETLHCSKSTGVAAVCTAVSSDFTSMPTGAGQINLTTSNFSNNSVVCGGQRRIR
jgi:hypothetical protein